MNKSIPAFPFRSFFLLTAISRVFTSLELLNRNLGLKLAASGWTMAFGAFILIYWPILSRPRVDGRPG